MTCLYGLNSRFPSHPYDSIPNPKLLIDELQLWLNDEVFNPISLLPFVPKFDLYVDASSNQWGALLKSNDGSQQSFAGTFDDVTIHINTLELLAIQLAIHQLPESVRCCDLMLKSDNVTAVKCIRVRGDQNNVQRNTICNVIYSYVSHRELRLRIMHVAGLQNVAADALSRESIIPSEAMLSQPTFDKLCRDLNLWPVVDLFATAANSRVGDLQSGVQVNALLLSWAEFPVVYAFPPHKLIGKVIYKWRQEGKGYMILVAADNPNSSWFSLLRAAALRILPLRLQQGDLLLPELEGHVNLSCEKLNMTAFVL